MTLSPFYDGPRVRQGWLEVPCDAHDRAKVFMAVGNGQDVGEWYPAYIDWDETGRRVAKIRPPVQGGVQVWIKVDGRLTRHNQSIIL